ncbi:hypothetical protein GCM10023185_02790 [Hymenobacter saemangeumensis]|uniref:Carboxypeptidase-like regulatory domain-containing protein n=1 Tax=Hymenobacter saemangeumensis TaxID=1084522 RepID=A0ABP8HYN5_9BACT
MATPSFTPSIPQPCPKQWADMSPTEAGRFCGSCQTEVVDFARMSDAEVLAYLSARRGQHVCGRLVGQAVLPQVYKPSSAPRRWLLAALALFGWQVQAASAGPPAPEPLPRLEEGQGSKPGKPGNQVTVRGQVLDDRDGKPVAGVRVLINDTNFGTTTDEQGNFELVMAPGWAPIKSGKLNLQFIGSPFDFEKQTVKLNTRSQAKPAALKVTMKSIPDRGQVVGRMMMPEPPVKPPRG